VSTCWGPSRAVIDRCQAMSVQHEEVPVFMLSEERIMEVLEAYDLTQSYRSAGLLCGVDPHTVARYVNARTAELPDPPQDRRWFLATSRFAVLREKRRLQRRMVEIPMDLPDGLPPSSPPGGAIVTDAAVEAGFLREVLDRLPERDAEVLRLLY
jgi:hypothetical protein